PRRDRATDYSPACRWRRAVDASEPSWHRSPDPAGRDRRSGPPPCDRRASKRPLSSHVREGPASARADLGSARVSDRSSGDESRGGGEVEERPPLPDAGGRGASKVVRGRSRLAQAREGQGALRAALSRARLSNRVTSRLGKTARLTAVQGSGTMGAKGFDGQDRISS